MIIATIRDYVEQLVEEGLEGLPASERAVRPSADATLETAKTAESAKTAAPARPVVAPARATAALFSAYPGLEKTAELRELREFIGDCHRCKLAPGRTNSGVRRRRSAGPS